MISIFILITFFFLINVLTREKFQLDDKQKETLLIFFPSEHINNIHFYKGGTFSLGSTRVICDSIYFRDKDERDKLFFNSPDDYLSLNLLVHEVTHTWQARKGCFSMSFSALYSQFKSFLTHGTRNHAYLYSLNADIKDLNPEQEASIVDNFYLLTFTNLTEFRTFCTDCGNTINETTFEILKNKTKNILEKYK